MYLQEGSKDFLMLIQEDLFPGDPNFGKVLKAVVRKVSLKPLGNWMMGKVRIYGRSFSVSGAYGSDGLPMTVPKEIFDRAPVALPQDLWNAWSKGGGWNSAGNEAPAMREWALKNLSRLRK